MDRQIVYPGQILPETTLLQMAKDAMIGMAKLSAAVLGTSTVVNGFAVTPTSPASMQVNVAPGEIYSLQNIDSTVFSSLAADTAHQVLKQGLALDAQLLTLTAPATVGQSINYLIEAAYQDADSTPVLLPYYNSANPASPYSGLGNNGLTQNTARKGAVVLQAKAGAAAATGSQTTPAPDSGYVGLYVVTVAYGQATIAAGNISQYAAAPFISMVSAAQLQAQTATAFTSAGTAPSFTLTPSPALTAYAANQRFRVKFHAAGAGSDTLNVSGLGAKSLKQYDSQGNKISAVIAANQLADVEYDGTDMVILDPLPPAATVKQLQPITASVSSNALTLGLNPTSLDFRSSTLSSGTVNTRTVGSALSLVVPSGATLGTDNGQSGRLVLLAIDNAGTVELAVANLAGGVNLDETTLISTTAISAAATSASTVYSTAARTSVPFRVVGVIDIAEAAAGTWATAPTTIQGIGGQALAAMSSLGYGQTWQNVTASRALGTTYYNTTGKPIAVNIYGAVSAQNGSITAKINGVTVGNGTGAAATGNQAGITGIIVPPGANYSFTAVNWSSTTNWSELR